MIIESPINLPLLPPSTNRRWPLVLGTIITLSATVLPLVLIVLPVNQPTGSLLSPQPKGEIASPPQTAPTDLSFSETVNLAQNYLDRAYELARNQNQNENDKKAIFTSLNESLKQATAAINLSPNNPIGYLLRAQIFTAISRIKPEAVALAKQDLDIAQQLSSGKDITLPTVVNPINLLPEEQAASSSSLLIASPGAGESTTSGKLDTQTNASQKRATLPANQTEVVVDDPLVKPNSYIYLVPVNSTNNPVSVKTKTIGSFTITATAANPTDQAIDYYIINE